MRTTRIAISLYLENFIENIAGKLPSLTEWVVGGRSAKTPQWRTSDKSYTAPYLCQVWLTARMVE